MSNGSFHGMRKEEPIMPKKVLPDGAKDVKVIGPYSPVVQIGNHFHYSGIIPDVEKDEQDGGKIKPTAREDWREQYRQVLRTMRERLAACGLTMDDVYSVQVMLRGSMAGYSEFNAMYAETLGISSVLPRRAVVAVSELPAGVEIELLFDAVKQDEPKKREETAAAEEGDPALVSA
jgi:enamine deaminase RidA (YjgF/YER057c/UK114 family)